MAKDPKSLAGKVVAITGGGRGIGRETAQALIAEGAKVAIGDIDADLARLTASELGSGTLGLELDVTQAASFEAFLTAVEQELGLLDVLINNAGIMPVGPFAQESDAVAHRLVDINIHGVIIGSKLALRRFAPRDSGHIVNIASAAGKIGLPGGATYSATKHAVVGLTEALRGELRGTHVKTHLIMPVVVETELGSGLSKIRLFGTVKPSDVAGAIVSALQQVRFDSYIPRAIGPVFALSKVVPRRLSEWILRLFGGDRVLAEADPVARAAYEARILPAPETDGAKSVADVAASVASAIES